MKKSIPQKKFKTEPKFEIGDKVKVKKPYTGTGEVLGIVNFYPTFEADVLIYALKTDEAYTDQFGLQSKVVLINEHYLELTEKAVPPPKIEKEDENAFELVGK